MGEANAVGLNDTSTQANEEVLVVLRDEVLRDERVPALMRSIGRIQAQETIHG